MNQTNQFERGRRRRIAWVALFSIAMVALFARAAMAQGSWAADTQISPGSGFGAPVIVPNTAAPEAAPAGQLGQVELEAFLSSEPGAVTQRPIDRGLVWRIYTLGGADQGAKLVATRREPTPAVALPPGRYAVNAAFGRAYLTEMIDISAGQRTRKTFVLNAGGLRVIVKVAGGARVAPNDARYDIFSDERDQNGKRRRVVSNAKPGLITRLNSGIYHVVSRLGDANAEVSADVAVEAGKMTEAIISHEAAKVTLKLVQRSQGEALADTQWIIMTRSGDIIKETAGALPTHMLAPGSYSVSARRAGKLFTRTFDVKSGDAIEVEVLLQ